MEEEQDRVEEEQDRVEEDDKEQGQNLEIQQPVHHLLVS